MAKDEWKVEVYLEPGEAWALNAGFLLTRVLDVLKNGKTEIAIVDASAALSYAGCTGNALSPVPSWSR